MPLIKDPRKRQYLQDLALAGVSAHSGGNFTEALGQIQGQRAAEQFRQQQLMLQQQESARDAEALANYRKESLALQREQLARNRIPNWDKMAGSGFWDPESITAAKNAYEAEDPNYLSKLENRRTLTSTETKIINDAQEKAFQGESNSARMLGLSQQFLSAGSDDQEGWVGAGRGFLREALGENNEEIDLIRRNYNQLRIKHTTKNLPPGPASDKDVALALKGWSDEFGDRAMMYSFLQGMAKLSVVEAVQARAKSAYMSEKQTNAGFTTFWNANKESLVNEAFESMGIQENDVGAEMYMDLFPTMPVETEAAPQESVEDRYNRLVGGSRPGRRGRNR